MATGLRCVAHYLRERGAEFNPLLHGLIPLASFALFIPVLLAALGMNCAGLGNSTRPPGPVPHTNRTPRTRAASLRAGPDPSGRMSGYPRPQHPPCAKCRWGNRIDSFTSHHALLRQDCFGLHS